MRKLCLTLAASILVATAAFAARADGPPPYDGPLIVEIYRTTAVINGVPVLHSEWICWDGHGWIPLRSIKGVPAERPIPRHQRRLE